MANYITTRNIAMATCVGIAFLALWATRVGAVTEYDAFEVPEYDDQDSCGLLAQPVNFTCITRRSEGDVPDDMRVIKHFSTSLRAIFELFSPSIDVVLQSTSAAVIPDSAETFVQMLLRNKKLSASAWYTVMSNVGNRVCDTVALQCDSYSLR